MRARIRRGKQHVLRFDVHMDNTVPTRLVSRRLIGAMATIAKRVRHGVKNMPQKSLGKNETVLRILSIMTARMQAVMERCIYRCV